MEWTEKLPERKPRVLHGPHRIRLSGIAAGRPASVEETAPTVIAGESEVVSSTVEIKQELVPLDELPSSST